MVSTRTLSTFSAPVSTFQHPSAPFSWRDAHLRLAAARRRTFSRKWRFNRALRRLVAAPTSVYAAALASRVAPGLLRYAIRYAGDVR